MLNVITLGQTKSDIIHFMITITGDFYIVTFRRLKCDYIKCLKPLKSYVTHNKNVI